MIRSSRMMNLLAVMALTGGCAGEGNGVHELLPSKDLTLHQAPISQSTLVSQQIANLGYSTYLGFEGDEFGTALAVDSSGNTYITGTTTTWGGINVFVAKMSATGTNIYFTYFPGTSSQGIAVDSGGNAYVASTGTAGATITKVNAAGTSMVYAASLGWNDVSAIQVDSAGNAYVVGSVNNSAAGVDVAVGKVNPTGTAFVYSLAFGGSGTDSGKGIAIDSSGNAYLTGTTDSTNFPVVSAYQATRRGPQDAFVAKLNPTGTALVFSTYLGGDTLDSGAAIAVDSAGSAYVTGTTAAFNGIESFPTTSGTVQSAAGGSGDAFVAKFGSTGSRIYASYIGGNGSDSGTSIAVSTSGIAYVTGFTNSTNLPTTNLAYQRFAPAGTNAFVVQLSSTFNAYTYSTYLGGGSSDTGASLAVNSSGAVFVTGSTNSSDFPTGVYGAGGGYDAFVTKFNGP